MDNLLGVADQVWLAGFWLNSGLQGEARANGKLDTSSLALHYLHGLPRPGLLGTLALAAAARRDPWFTIKTCCCSTTRVTTSCCCAIRWSTIPWLSSEAAFIQRFSQPYSRAAAGPGWQLAHQTAPVRSSTTGALFPLVDAFRSRSGPDAEDYQWLMHQARPALSVDAKPGSMAIGCGSTRCRATRWRCMNLPLSFSSGADPAP